MAGCQSSRLQCSAPQPHLPKSAVKLHFLSQSLTGHLCSGNQDCPKLLLTVCQKPLTKCLPELQNELLYTFHFTNTLIPPDPLNGCPKTLLSSELLPTQPKHDRQKSSHRQLHSYRTQSLPLFPSSDYSDSKHTDFLKILHVWYVLYLPHL